VQVGHRCREVKRDGTAGKSGRKPRSRLTVPGRAAGWSLVTRAVTISERYTSMLEVQLDQEPLSGHRDGRRRRTVT
jgi:hypothetical protein